MIVNRQIGGSGGGASGELGEPTVNTSTGIVTATVTKGGVLEEGASTALQLPTQAAKTVTPTFAAQTAVAAGRYTTGAVKVAAVSDTGKQAKSGTFSLSSAFSSKAISGLGFCPRSILLAQRGSVFANYLQSLYAAASSSAAFTSSTVEASVACIGTSTSGTSFYEVTFNSSGSVKVAISSNVSTSSTNFMSGSYTYVIWGTDE